jgi:hypothetical protein
MYVIRVFAVTTGKERNRTVERVWAGCFIYWYITAKRAQDGNCVIKQYCVMDQFGVRF